MLTLQVCAVIVTILFLIISFKILNIIVSLEKYFKEIDEDGAIRYLPHRLQLIYQVFDRMYNLMYKNQDDIHKTAKVFREIRRGLMIMNNNIAAIYSTLPNNVKLPEEPLMLDEEELKD